MRNSRRGIRANRRSNLPARPVARLGSGSAPLVEDRGQGRNFSGCASFAGRYFSIT